MQRPVKTDALKESNMMIGKGEKEDLFSLATEVLKNEHKIIEASKRKYLIDTFLDIKTTAKMNDMIDHLKIEEFEKLTIEEQIRVLKNVSEVRKNIRGKGEVEININNGNKLSTDEIVKFFGELHESKSRDTIEISAECETVPDE